jgi:hypothetical protein
MQRSVGDGDPHRAVAYIRCSMSRQDLSPDAQAAAIREWPQLQGVEVVAIHEDRAAHAVRSSTGGPNSMAHRGRFVPSGAGVQFAAKRDALARDIAVVSAGEYRVSARRRHPAR